MTANGNLSDRTPANLSLNRLSRIRSIGRSSEYSPPSLLTMARSRVSIFSGRVSRVNFSGRNVGFFSVILLKQI